MHFKLARIGIVDPNGPDLGPSNGPFLDGPDRISRREEALIQHPKTLMYTEKGPTVRLSREIHLIRL